MDRKIINSIHYQLMWDPYKSLKCVLIILFSRISGFMFNNFIFQNQWFHEALFILILFYSKVNCKRFWTKCVFNSYIKYETSSMYFAGPFLKERSPQSNLHQQQYRYIYICASWYTVSIPCTEDSRSTASTQVFS